MCTQLCPTLCDPKDCSLPGSSVHGILQARILEWVATTLFRLVITFLPRSKCLLISWLQSLSAVILETKKIKYVTVSTFSPAICHEVKGLDAMILVFFLNVEFQANFFHFTLSLIKRLFSLSSLSVIRVINRNESSVRYCYLFFT